MTMKPQEIIDRFTEIKVSKPVEVIIEQIENLIVSGTFKPGDRLPAERILADRFGVGRGHVREALKRLEFNGILKILPQSGTYVAALGTKAMEGLLENMIDPEKDHLGALLETRLILEVNAARLAAKHADRKDLIEMIRIHEAFRGQLKKGDPDMTEDHRFHRKIATLSKNPVLCSLIVLIARSTDADLKKQENASDEIPSTILREHEAILQAIKQKDPDRAALAMEAHMETVLNRFG